MYLEREILKEDVPGIKEDVPGKGDLLRRMYLVRRDYERGCTWYKEGCTW
jgi:hypothetical protein